MHEAGEPNALVDFFDAKLLSCQHDRDVDPLAMQAEAATGCDDDVAIVEWLGEFRQAIVVTC